MATKAKKAVANNKRLYLLLSVLGALIVIGGLATFAAPIKSYIGPKSTAHLTVINNATRQPIEGVGVKWFATGTQKSADTAGRTDSSGNVTLTVPTGPNGMACFSKGGCADSCRLIDATQSEFNNTQALLCSN